MSFEFRNPSGRGATQGNKTSSKVRTRLADNVVFPPRLRVGTYRPGIKDSSPIPGILSNSFGDPAAVDRERRAGRGLGIVRAEIDGEAAQMLGRGELMHRLLLAEQRVLLGRDCRAVLLGAILDLLLDQR